MQEVESSQAEVLSVLPVRNLLGEGICYDPRVQKVFWVDILQSRLWAYHELSGQLKSWETPELPSAVFLTMNEDELVVTADHTLWVFSIERASWRKWDELQPIRPGLRFNDGAVTPNGSLLIGTMDKEGREPLGSLYSYKANRFRSIFDHVTISNGIDWSPSESEFYFVESQSRTIHRFSDGENVTHRGHVCRLPEDWGEPDGLCADQSGDLWVCCWDGGCLVKVNPATGAIGLKLFLPVVRPTNLVIVPNQNLAYVTSASLGVQGPYDGALLKLSLPGALGAKPRYLAKIST